MGPPWIHARSGTSRLRRQRPGRHRITFKEQEHEGFEVWQKEFTSLRFPHLYNLRADPFERGPESIEYNKWSAERMFVVVPAQTLIAQWLQSFKEFPIRQKPSSFNLDEVREKMTPKQ